MYIYSRLLLVGYEGPVPQRRLVRRVAGLGRAAGRLRVGLLGALVVVRGGVVGDGRQHAGQLHFLPVDGETDAAARLLARLLRLRLLLLLLGRRRLRVAVGYLGRSFFRDKLKRNQIGRVVSGVQ